MVVYGVYMEFIEDVATDERRGGRCEDAPCCGCCTPAAMGWYDDPSDHYDDHDDWRGIDDYEDDEDDGVVDDGPEDFGYFGYDGMMED